MINTSEILVITHIEKVQRHHQQFAIFINHKMTCIVHEDILIQYHLIKDKHIEPQLLEELQSINEQHKVYLTAISYLSRRPHASKEMYLKLRKKKYPLPLINEVIDKLKQQNYLNDQQFAEQWVQQQVTNFHGIQRTRFELKQKGLTQEHIDHAMQSYSKEMEIESAVYLIRKKLRQLSTSKSPVRSKLISFLQRKGFSQESILASLQFFQLKNEDHDEIFFE